MDFFIGVAMASLGLGFIAVPWALSLGSTRLASITIIAGGVIVTLLGVALMRRAPRGARSRRRHNRGDA